MFPAKDANEASILGDLVSGTSRMHSGKLGHRRQQSAEEHHPVKLPLVIYVWVGLLPSLHEKCGANITSVYAWNADTKAI